MRTATSPSISSAGKSRERAQTLGPGGVYLEHVERVRRLAAGARQADADLGRRRPRAPGAHRRDSARSRAARLVVRSGPRLRSRASASPTTGSASGSARARRRGTACIRASRTAPRTSRATRRRDGATAPRALLVTDWGDFGHYNLLGNSCFGYAWAAQQAWSGDVPPARFDRAFARAALRRRERRDDAPCAGAGRDPRRGLRAVQRLAAPVPLLRRARAGLLRRRREARELAAHAAPAGSRTHAAARGRPSFPARGAHAGRRCATRSTPRATPCARRWPGQRYLAWRRRPQRLDAARAPAPGERAARARRRAGRRSGASCGGCGSCAASRTASRSRGDASRARSRACGARRARSRRIARPQRRRRTPASRSRRSSGRWRRLSRARVSTLRAMPAR